MTNLQIILLFLFSCMLLNSMILLLVSMRSSQITQEEEADSNLPLLEKDLVEQKRLAALKV